MLKLVKYILMAFIVITLCLLVALFIFSDDKSDQTSGSADDQTQKSNNYAVPSQRIRGLKFSKYSGSKKVLSIKCRHLAIRRKKLGFVRFNLMKEAVLEEGAVNIFQYTDSEKTGTSDNTGIDAFDMMFSKDSAFLPGSGRISSVIIHPVTVKFYTNQTLETIISARSAEIRLTRRKFMFEDNVTVRSGERKLVLDTLELNPDNKRLIGNDYVLYTSKGKTSGRSITTGFDLKRIDE